MLPSLHCLAVQRRTRGGGRLDALAHPGNLPCHRAAVQDAALPWESHEAFAMIAMARARRPHTRGATEGDRADPLGESNERGVRKPEAGIGVPLGNLHHANRAASGQSSSFTVAEPVAVFDHREACSWIIKRLGDRQPALALIKAPRACLAGGYKEPQFTEAAPTRCLDGGAVEGDSQTAAPIIAANKEV